MTDEAQEFAIDRGVQAVCRCRPPSQRLVQEWHGTGSERHLPLASRAHGGSTSTGPSATRGANLLRPRRVPVLHSALSLRDYAPVKTPERRATAELF